MDNWVHRSAGMRCGTCMWWVLKSLSPAPTSANKEYGVKETYETKDFGAIRLGRCRRHSPIMSGWPATFETDWCGDHKLDEEKI